MIPGRMFGPYITRDVYNTYSSPNCYETTFEIELLKPEDLGAVYVYISNERGLVSAQINIQLSRFGPQTMGSQDASSPLGSSRGFMLGAGQQAASSAGTRNAIQTSARLLLALAGSLVSLLLASSNGAARYLMMMRQQR